MSRLVVESDSALDRYGSPGSSLVIALHGAVANRKTWLPLARMLDARFELWCPDLPGHGSLRDRTFTLADALGTIDDLVAAARPRRPILIGDSLGGYLALAAAARAVDGVAGVVAGGCSWSMAGPWGVLARASDVVPRIVERALGTARLERFAAAIVPRLTDAVTARAIVAGGLRVTARSESLRELAGLDLMALVRRIDVPIVFVNGARDWPTRAGERGLLRAAHGASLAIAPRVGHGVGLFAPEIFVAGIGIVENEFRSA